MSSAQSPHGQEPATLQSTRQILDELDALMDRMLAIPVNHVDDPAPLEGEMPTTSATLTVLEEPLEEAPYDPDMLPDRLPSYLTDQANTFDPRSLLAPTASPEVEPMPGPSLSTALTTSTIAEPRPSAALVTLPLPRRSWASRAMLPLLLFNQAFDAGTLILGAPGRWLRAPQGRHVLGLAGLGLLGAAGLWLAKDWLGWTW